MTSPKKHRASHDLERLLWTLFFLGNWKPPKTQQSSCLKNRAQNRALGFPGRHPHFARPFYTDENPGPQVSLLFQWLVGLVREIRYPKNGAKQITAEGCMNHQLPRCHRRVLKICSGTPWAKHIQMCTPWVFVDDDQDFFDGKNIDKPSSFQGTWMVFCFDQPKKKVTHTSTGLLGGKSGLGFLGY